MKRLVVFGVVLALVAGTALAGEAAKAKSPDQIIKELMSDAEGPAPQPAQLEADYRVAVASLVKGLAGDDMSKWATADRTLETLCHRAAAPGREAHRAAVAKALLAHVKDAGLTKLGRTRVIRHLERTSGGEAVKPLAALLTDKDLREPARRALMRNPTPEAGDALRAALAKADKSFRLALVDALGFRREAKSVQPILALAGDADDDTRTHAVEALARIGDGSAAAAIAAATKKGSDHAKSRATNAYLALADALVAKGEKAPALKIYRGLIGSAGFRKCAALVGIGKAGSAADVDTLVASVITPKAAERGAAVQGLILLTDPKATAGIAAKAKGAEPVLKAQLVAVLGKRGDPAATPALLEAAKDKDEAVRTAACQALGELKAAQAVPVLVAALGSASAPEREKAEWALSKVPGDEATNAILAALPKATGEAKIALVRSLGCRRDAKTLPALTQAAGDADDKVRIAAYRSIGQLNSAQALPTIIAALSKEKGEVLDAVAYALRRTHGKEATAATVAAAKTAPPAALAPILTILSWREDPAVKGLLVASARHADPGVQAAALDGLSRVKDPAAVPILIQVATKGEGAVRDAAVRTSLQYVDEIGKADAAAAVTLFGLALDRKIVPHYDDRRVALRALGSVGGPEVVPALANAFRDRRLSRDAHNAVFGIADRLRKAGKKAEATEVYTTLARLSNDHGMLRRAQGELRKLGVEGDLAARAGFISRWHVCGPFPNANNALFSQTLEPEKKGADIILAVSAAGVEREWKPLGTTDPAGVLDLRQLLGNEDNTGALLYAEITVAKDAEVLLKLGYEEGCIAYVNGKKVHSRAGSRFTVDDQRVKASLKAGSNKLLLKVVHLTRGWRLCARITGRKDEPVAFTQKEK